MFVGAVIPKYKQMVDLIPWNTTREMLEANGKLWKILYALEEESGISIQDFTDTRKYILNTIGKIQKQSYEGMDNLFSIISNISDYTKSLEFIICFALMAPILGIAGVKLWKFGLVKTKESETTAMWITISGFVLILLLARSVW